MHPHQDPTTLLSALSLSRPPLAGGSPDDPEAEGTPAPPEQAPPSTTIEPPFRLEDIEDPAQREFLRGRHAQMQSGFDKELNRLRAEYDPVKELTARLGSDDPAERDAALAEFAGQYGYELDLGEEISPDPADAGVERVAPEDNELLERLDAVEQRQLAEDEDKRVAQFTAHIDAGLAALAEQEGVKSVEEIPEEIKEQVLSNALALPRLENGLLDMKTAITRYDAQVTFHVERRKAGYLKSKDTPHVDLSSEQADPTVDLTDKQKRLARANAVAGKHV